METSEFYNIIKNTTTKPIFKGQEEYNYYIFNFLQSLVRTIKGAKPPNWKLSWNLDVEKVTKSHKKE